VRRPIVCASVRWRVARPALMALPHLLMLGLLSFASAQQPSIHYVYDRQSRLVAVVDQQGSVAAYVYDAVGNLLRIDRVDADSIAGSLAITLVSPRSEEHTSELQSRFDLVCR